MFGLRGRLFALLVLVTVPVLGVILYIGIEQRAEAGRVARESALALARTVASAHETEVAKANQLLEALAKLPALRSPEPAKCSAFLASMLESGSSFANLGLIGLDGQVLCSALPMTPEVNLADREYFRRALSEGSFAVGDYQIGRITGVASVNFGYPVRDERGTISAVVFAALPLAKLAALVDVAKLPEGSVVNVSDANGTILYREPEPELWVGQQLADAHLLEFIRRSGGEGTVETEGVDGIERLYGFADLSRVLGHGGVEMQADLGHVYVSVGLPRAFAYAAQNRALLMTAATASGLVLLLLAVGWWGSGAFVLKPVRGLLAATRRLGEGDLTARADVPARAGEISELAHAFDAMAAGLEEREREIRSQIAHIARLNRLYAMLSGSNQALLRIRDEQELFTEACRIAVSKGGFRLAWVARFEGEPPVFRPVIHAGEGSFEPEALAVPAASDPEAKEETFGPVLAAGQRVVINRLADEGHGTEALGNALAALGCGAFAALPLRRKNKVEGALFVAAAEESFFDREETELLIEVAADLSLGLEIIDNQRSLTALAYRDRVTGLANRPMFEKRLAEALDDAKDQESYLGVQVIGVGGLPEVDGTMGPLAGDEMLAEVARSLAEKPSAVDTVARIGREEFGIVLGCAASPSDISQAAATVLDAVPKVVSAGGVQVSTRPHSGLAVFPYDGTNPEELVRRALLAHHQALRTRSAEPLFYSEEFDAEARERRKIEGELRLALERKEFALHYQPIVNLSNGEAVGVEALLRWRSPYLGDVPPAKFIPVAEESLLIKPIGAWALKTACEQAKRWAEAGLPRLKISVNVSAIQLHEGDFLGSIKKIFAEAGYDPRQSPLEIEITESRLMENVDFFARFLKEMKGLGALVVIDDFGTGYSSLSRIKELEVDGLKIDLSFVRGLERGADAVTLVKGIVAMAQALDLEVVAEGVETEGQASILRDLGCNYGQGYLFGRPGPAEAVAQYFLRGGAAPRGAGSALGPAD